MSWLSSKFKKATKPIRKAGRFADVTSSKSFSGFGKYVRPIAKPVIATAAAAVTGGASVVAGEKGAISKSTFGVKTTAQGYATGAAIGTAIAGGAKASDIGGKFLAGAKPLTTPSAQQAATTTTQPQFLQAGIGGMPIVLFLAAGVVAFLIYGRK